MKVSFLIVSAAIQCLLSHTLQNFLQTTCINQARLRAAP